VGGCGEYLERQLRQPRADKAAVRRQIMRYRRNPDFCESLWSEAVRRCRSEGILKPSDELIHATLLGVWLSRLTPQQRVEAVRGAGRAL
jgi:hypothetical protein